MKKSTSQTASLPLHSRRDFLRLGTAAAGALFTAGTPLHLLDNAVNQAASALSGKIAVLIPRSGPGEAAYNAFVQAFAGQYPGVELLTTAVRPYWSDVTQAARRLIENDRVKVIVTLMNPTISSDARDLFASSDAVLIVASAGENIIRAEDRLPNIFHASLHLWESNHALGRWAVETYGQRGVISSSLYDSGFDALYAFQMGVEDAGGEISRTHIQLKTDAAQELSTLREILQVTRPDFIFRMHSQTSNAETELTALAASLGIPLLRTSLSAIPNAEGAVVTAFEPDAQHDSIWQKAYTRLGLDAAMLAATALSAGQAARQQMPAMCQALRGLPAMHPIHQTLSAPLRLHRSQQIQAASLPSVDCDCVIEKIAAGGAKTGFTTPYLMM